MLGRPLIRLDVVTSTMSVLADLVSAGAGEGTTVVAEFQTAGRGRSTRSWIAPPYTALLASVLLRPPLTYSHMSPLSILVADSIAESLTRLYGLEAKIKWPNDVLVRGRKVSGVLIQTRMQPHGMTAIVGMGINVNITPADLPPDGTSVLAELGEAVERDMLMQHVLSELDTRYRELLADDRGRSWHLIQHRLAMVGELVRVVEGEETLEGVLMRVDTDGALILDCSGTSRRIVVGDMTRGPGPAPTSQL